MFSKKDKFSSVYIGTISTFDSSFFSIQEFAFLYSSSERIRKIKETNEIGELKKFQESNEFKKAQTGKKFERLPITNDYIFIYTK